MTKPIEVLSPQEIVNRIPDFQTRWNEFTAHISDEEQYVPHMYIEIPFEWLVYETINAGGYDGNYLAELVMDEIPTSGISVDQGNLESIMHSMKSMKLGHIANLQITEDKERFNNANHSLFLVVWKDTSNLSRTPRWPAATASSFLVLNGLREFSSPDNFYWRRPEFSPYTGQYVICDWEGSSTYSRDRNYTKCYNCGLFDRPRSRMVRVLDLRPIGSRRTNKRIRNICDNCVIKISETYQTYITVPSEIRNFEDDEVDTELIPKRDYLTLQVRASNAPFLTFTSTDKEKWESGSVGRFVRRHMNRVKIYATDYEFETLGEAENYTYPFAVHEHNWNYTPTFYYTHNTRVIDDVEEDFVSVQTENAEEIQWHDGWGPFLGVELECTVRQDRTDMNSSVEQVKEKLVRLFHPTDYPENYKQQGPHQLLFRKRDGSLDSHLGTEFVSMPLSSDYWTNYTQESFWNYFKDNFRALNDSRCGIHIHIPWVCMTPVERWIFFTMIDSLQTKEENKQFFMLITERSDTGYARWHNLAYDEGRRKSKYPIFSVALERQQNDYDNNPKYNAVNTQHDASIELRHFQGNTGKNGVLSKIQFVTALYDISKMFGAIFKDWDYEQQEPPQELIDLIEHFSKNTVDLICGWIARAMSVYNDMDNIGSMKENRYHHLHNLIARKIANNEFVNDTESVQQSIDTAYEITNSYIEQITQDEYTQIERTS